MAHHRYFWAFVACSLAPVPLSCTLAIHNSSAHYRPTGTPHIEATLATQGVSSSTVSTTVASRFVLSLVRIRLTLAIRWRLRQLVGGRKDHRRLLYRSRRLLQVLECGTRVVTRTRMSDATEFPDSTNVVCT